MATWADAVDVFELTGVSVTPDKLTQAQGVMDIYSGVVIEAQANLRARDRRLLRMATAYQAAWQAAQVDVTSRTEVKDLHQDGVWITPAGEDSLFLAPLARRCLGQLSWKRARSVRTTCGERRFATIEAYQAAWLRDEDRPDQYADWRPL